MSFVESASVSNEKRLAEIKEQLQAMGATELVVELLRIRENPFAAYQDRMEGLCPS